MLLRHPPFALLIGLLAVLAGLPLLGLPNTALNFLFFVLVIALAGRAGTSPAAMAGNSPSAMPRFSAWGPTPPPSCRCAMA